ncbi:MAG: LptF/LptG family permease [Bacteroidales bacterium]|jgi:lipopolysaccharide export system permease protein|nr:LptF/LptG family permease [Bacteroidales bacterium]
MKILHRFMLKQFIGPFVLVFIIVVFVLLMQFLWKWIDELVGKGLELSIIGELLLYTSANLTIMAFPLAVLLSSILTLGNMGENYELIALKAAGISLQRIVFPLIVLSFIIGIIAFLFANNITPFTNLKMRSLINDIRQQRPELSIREGAFSDAIDGYSIRIGKKDHKTNLLYDIMIYDHTEKLGNTTVILADSGHMAVTADKRFLEVVLYSGHRYREEVADKKSTNKKNNTYPFSHQTFEQQTFRMVLPSFDFERSEDDQILKKGYQMMSLDQLKVTIDSMKVVVKEHEDHLRSSVKPAYQFPDYPPRVRDTIYRSKITDHFMTAFDLEPKTKRQEAIQAAINDARNQKDQFAGTIYELDFKSKQTWRYEVEWHRKFTMSLACIILFFIGAPLGAIIRKGGLGTPIIIAVIFFVLYYVISMIGEKAAKGGTLTPFLGMWMSTFIVLPIGVFLTYLATRDSSIFNQDLYLSYIKKGLGFIFAIYPTSRANIDIKVSQADMEPENIINEIDELSQKCKVYLEDDLSRLLRLTKIFQKDEDPILTGIGHDYDRVKAILEKSDIDLIRETVREYPNVSLHDYKIKLQSKWQAIAIMIIVPVWLYLYLKALIQKNNLRNDLKNIMGANRNLINEINSTL